MKLFELDNQMELRWSYLDRIHVQFTNIQQRTRQCQTWTTSIAPKRGVLGMSLWKNQARGVVGTGLFETITARHTIKAFASESWMYYLASFIDCLGFYCFNIRFAMLSALIPADEIGKVLSFTSAFDSLLPIGISALYSKVYGVSVF